MDGVPTTDEQFGERLNSTFDIVIQCSAQKEEVKWSKEKVRWLCVQSSGLRKGKFWIVNLCYLNKCLS